MVKEESVLDPLKVAVKNEAKKASFFLIYIFNKHVPLIKILIYEAQVFISNYVDSLAHFKVYSLHPFLILQDLNV